MRARSDLSHPPLRPGKFLRCAADDACHAWLQQTLPRGNLHLGLSRFPSADLNARRRRPCLSAVRPQHGSGPIERVPRDAARRTKGAPNIFSISTVPSLYTYMHAFCNNVLRLAHFFEAIASFKKTERKEAITKQTLVRSHDYLVCAA